LIAKNGKRLLMKSDFPKTEYTFDDLQEIMRILRAPDGCPWDSVQTHNSIRSNCIEEAYELCDAIKNNDLDNMEEECGDVLLQVLLHAAISEESGGFTLKTVVNRLADKLVRRHTHIFGENKAENEKDALKFWDAAQSKEKGKTAKTPSEKVKALPKSFPALIRAQKSVKHLKEAEEGLADRDYLKNRIASLSGALIGRGTDAAGELLYYIAALAKLDGVDAEIALNGYIDSQLR
jgi:tetrapyrrole methylase family protein/MazG family protein